MKNIIWLKDMKEEKDPVNDKFDPELVRECRGILEKRGLRFSNKTGIIRDNTGELERYTVQSEFEPHETLEEVMRWEFTRYIFNSCSRVLYGYKA